VTLEDALADSSLIGEKNRRHWAKVLLPHINVQGLRESLKDELVILSEGDILTMKKPRYVTGIVLATRPCDGKVLLVQQVGIFHCYSS
jgi:hypothetical protein